MADSIEVGGKVAAMWERLADQISDAIPNLVIEGKPEEAVRWATCAEACFWKSTGEADCHDVKHVLASPSQALALSSKDGTQEKGR